MVLLLSLLLLNGEIAPDAARLAAMFKARYAMAKGDYQRALSFCDEAIALDDGDAEAAYLKVEVMFDMSSRTPLAALRKQNDLLKTLSLFMGRFPNDYRFPKAMGVFLVNEPMLLKEQVEEQPDFYLNHVVNLLANQEDKVMELSDTHYYLGLWHYRKQNYYEASKSFLEVARIEPNAGWAIYYAARSLEASHQLRKALQYYERYMNLSSSDPATYETPVPFSMGLLRLMVSPSEATRKTLLSWLEHQGDSRELYLRAAGRLLGVSLFEETLAVLLSMPVSDRSVEYFRLLSLCRMSLHQYDLLFEDIKVGIEQTSDAAGRRLLVEFAMEAGMNAGRFQDVLQLRATFPNIPGSDVKLDLYASFAQALHDGESSHWQKAQVRYHSSDMVRIVARQVEHSSLESVALKNLVQLYMAWDDWDDALARMKTDLNSWQGGDELAVVYYLMGRVDESFTLYEQLLKDFPGRQDILNNYGYFLTETGKDLERARDLLSQVISQDGNNGSYLDSMGWVLFKLGDYQQAETFMLKALAMEKDDPEKLEHLGDLYHAMGRTEEARLSWMKAMDFADDRYLKILDKLDPKP